MTARKHPSGYKTPDPWAPFRCGQKSCGHPVYGSAARLGCLYCECDETTHKRRADAAATGSEGADGPAGPQDSEGT